MKLLQQLSHFLYEYRQMSGKYRIRMLYQWMNPAITGIFIYRLERGLYLSLGRAWGILRIPFLPLIQLAYAYSRCDISYKADIGKGLKILHPSLGILISGKARLGEHVVLTGGNAIGGKSGMGGGALIIGDYVDLGANASIIGPCKVGNYVSIGANAAVVKDTPDFCAVAGVPARVLHTRKPHILVVIDQMKNGGAEKICLLQCNLLANAGLQISLVMLNEGGQLSQELNPEIRQYVLNRKSKYDRTAARQLNQLAAGADLIHVHMRHNYRFTRWALWGAEKASKIILHDHFGDPKVPMLMGSLLRPAYYIGVSPWNTQWALEKLKISQERIFHLPNTIPATQIPGSPQRSQERKLLMVGNIRPVKNNLFALQLLQNSNWKLDIFSQHPDPIYLQKLLEEATRLGVAERLLIRNETFNPALHAREYNLAIHTSHSETGPLVLLEYLAAGLPFLSFRTGAIAEEAATRFEQMVINHFEPNQWLERLEALYQNAPAGEALQEFFQTQHSPEHYLQTCLKIYQHILRSSL